MDAVTRQQVADRAGRRCEYCQSPDAFSLGSFAVEHVHPSALGGPDALDNLAWSCPGCNQSKYTATEAPDPSGGAMAPLYHPRRQVWSDHFTWSSDLLAVQGLTPTGRATIVRLGLNRPEVVNLRRLLANNGLHPAQEDAASGDDVGENRDLA